MPSLTAHIRGQLVQFGATRAFTFLCESASAGAAGPQLAEDRLSFADLDRRARSVAVWLQERGHAGGRAVLMYPTGPEFLVAFVGCLYAGVAAVPAPMPTTPLAVRRLQAITDDVRPQAVLTTRAGATLFADVLEQSGDVPACAVTDGAPLGDSERWSMPTVEADDTALIQYTSGSTSDPKGVLVTHGNLLHNEREMSAGVHSTSESIVVGWIPHFHDMGLIGVLLHPLYIGCDCIVLAPTVFLKRPVRWLEAISRHRATITVAPDFAYEMCTRTVTDAQLAALDLSSLAVAMNGSEPIRAATVERFVERFGPVGMRATSMYPCFGMAEATLLVTGSRFQTGAVVGSVDPQALERGSVRPATDGTRLIGSGRPQGAAVRIVDPETLDVLPPNRVGEIWVSGASVAAGYWNRPDATSETFAAHTATGDGPYLRTGDLGYLMEGELFVTGRLKDLIIVNGRNLYAHDIEALVRDLHPALGAATGAAFAVRADREHVVVVHEVKLGLLRDVAPADLAGLVRVGVGRHFDLPALTVAIVARGAVPRTTSNKIQRARARQLFLDRGFNPLHEIVDPAVEVLRRPVPRTVGDAAPPAAVMAESATGAAWQR